MRTMLESALPAIAIGLISTLADKYRYQCIILSINFGTMRKWWTWLGKSSTPES
jgi:hypothetical protein